MRYVLEGSVRKAGDRVRITAQLNDVATGSHIWAERYDRDLADIFELQDEISEGIVGAVAPEILDAEVRHARSKRPDNLVAYDCVLRAYQHLCFLPSTITTRRLISCARQSGSIRIMRWPMPMPAGPISFAFSSCKEHRSGRC